MAVKVVYRDETLAAKEAYSNANDTLKLGILRTKRARLENQARESKETLAAYKACIEQHKRNLNAIKAARSEYYALRAEDELEVLEAHDAA